MVGGMEMIDGIIIGTLDDLEMVVAVGIFKGNNFEFASS